MRPCTPKRHEDVRRCGRRAELAQESDDVELSSPDARDEPALELWPYHEIRAHQLDRMPPAGQKSDDPGGRHNRVAPLVEAINACEESEISVVR